VETARKALYARRFGNGSRPIDGAAGGSNRVGRLAVARCTGVNAPVGPQFTFG